MKWQGRTRNAKSQKDGRNFTGYLLERWMDSSYWWRPAKFSPFRCFSGFLLTPRIPDCSLSLSLSLFPDSTSLFAPQAFAFSLAQAFLFYPKPLSSFFLLAFLVSGSSSYFQTPAALPFPFVVFLSPRFQPSSKNSPLSCRLFSFYRGTPGP